MSKSLSKEAKSVIDILKENNIGGESKTKIRAHIQAGAIAWNGSKLSLSSTNITQSDLLPGGYGVVRVSGKDYFSIKFVAV